MIRKGNLISIFSVHLGLWQIKWLERVIQSWYSVCTSCFDRLDHWKYSYKGNKVSKAAGFRLFPVMPAVAENKQAWIWLYRCDVEGIDLYLRAQTVKARITFTTSKTITLVIFIPCVWRSANHSISCWWMCSNMARIGFSRAAKSHKLSDSTIFEVRWPNQGPLKYSSAQYSSLACWNN